MKIVYLVPEMEQGGVEECTFELAKGMVDHGHQVSVVSHGGRLASRLRKEGVVIKKAPLHRKDPVSFGRSFFSLLRFCRQWQPDILHAMSRVPAWVGYFLTRYQNRGHLVTTFHSFYNTHWPSQIMGKGERVIAVSQALAEYARSSFQVSDDHLRIVVNGISLGKIERTRPGRYLRVGTLARWSTGKGFSLFLKVMQVLVKEGHPVQGLIGVGLPAAGLKASSRLKAEIEEHGLSDRVSLLLNPRREDFFSRIDVYAGCFTRPEGFGRVVVEAQWCRVVPVASALGGVREVIRDGETGFLVEPRAAAFVERLKLLLSNDWLREKMGQAAATWVRQKFSAERMVEETVAVYRELV